MTPTQLAAYRDSKQIPQTAQKICPKCKIRRSIAQYDKGCTKCKKCVKRIGRTNWFRWYVMPDRSGMYEVQFIYFTDSEVYKAKFSEKHWLNNDGVIVLIENWRGLSEQP